MLEFLSSKEVNIPVAGINIGPVHKKDILRANVMNEKGFKKYAVLLAFDVGVNKEARELAEEFGVKASHPSPLHDANLSLIRGPIEQSLSVIDARTYFLPLFSLFMQIFTADVIYHLFDQFTAYMKTIRAAEQEAARLIAVFPCVLKILPNCIFNKKDPIVLGVEVVEGIAKVGTPICIPTKDGIDLGRIASIELNHKAVDKATVGQSVAMKIESTNAVESSRLYGRHFDFNDNLVSRITRESINSLKEFFADEMTKDDWRLVIKLKKTFKID